MSAVALQPTQKLRQYSLLLPACLLLLSCTLSCPLPPAQTTSSKLFKLPPSRLRSSSGYPLVEHGGVVGWYVVPYDEMQTNAIETEERGRAAPRARQLGPLRIRAK